MSRISPRRWILFFRLTSAPDRIALAILLVWAGLRLAAAFGHPPPFARFVTAAFTLAVAYLVVRLFLWFRKRLLWRLRNRLIVAYVLIAVVPVVLLLAMVVVSSYLLYLQLGAHLLHDELDQRITTIAADTDAVAGAIQREAEEGANSKDRAVLLRPRVASLIAADKTEWPGMQVLLNRGQDLLAAGDGHSFKGLVEFRLTLAFASVQSRAGPAGMRSTVLLVAPLNSELLDSFGPELGPIQLTLLVPASAGTQGRPSLVPGYAPGQQIVSRIRKLSAPAHWFDYAVHGVSTFDAYHVERRTNALRAPVQADFTLRPFTVNESLFSSVGYAGPVLIDALIFFGIVFLLLEIAALATGIVLTRTITGAVAQLYNATLHVRRGDFSHRIRITHHDQLAALGDSFNEMTASVSELIEEQRQRQRLENDVSIAREVQEQLFPRSFPVLPGLQLAAICRPARAVSGDYYDFIQMGPSRVGIVLADISGKGISAALLMASLQAALRSGASLDGQGGTMELVARLNQHLFKNTSDDRYATLFYAIYDADAKTLTYTNAGHLAPFFLADGKVQQLEEGGTVVGLFENTTYRQRTIQVAPASLLVAFSDGLTEPENVYGEEFGVVRLKAEVVRQAGAPAQLLAENLIAATDRWAGTPEQADDVTVVIARMDS